MGTFGPFTIFEMLKKILATLWKRKLMTLIAVVFVGGCSYAVLGGGNTGPAYEFAEASYVDIVQEVSVTGTVEADAKIDLRFQTAGQVDTVFAEVGDYVEKGDTLAQLDTTSLSIKAAAAQADLALAQANYNKELAGSTPEAIQVAEASVEKSKADLSQAQENYDSTQALADERVAAAQLDYDSALNDYENATTTSGEDVVHAYEDLHNTIDDVLNEVEDALREADNILGVDNTRANANIETALTANSQQEFSSAQNDYTDASDLHDSLSEEFESITDSDYDELDAFSTELDELLDDTDDLLDATDDILDDAPTIGGYTESVKETHRAEMAAEIDDIAAASTNFKNAIQAVESANTSSTTQLSSYQLSLNEAEQALSQAQVQAETDVNQAEVSVQVYEALLAQAEATLADVTVGPRDVDLASLVASIDSASAALSLAQHNLSLAYLTAPASGVVTEIYFDEGENVTTTESFLVMVSEEYQIIANVSETDIAKVGLGDMVNFTLDAYSYDKQFQAEITEIDPAETIVQGVIYYQITATFTSEDTPIKPGMTANMDIVTAEVNGVLAVPIRAVKYDGPRTYILQLDESSGELLEVDIEAGVRGDQYVEILEGLEEGDPVLTYVR